MNRNDLRRDIIEHNRARESASLCAYACRSDDANRHDPDRETVPDWENVRAPFFHDADRILHSLAYSRYIDKTQVFYLFDNDHITHRVLHVQFVSKIARTIARCLRLNEDLVEAISLGHDIGHVPFGHEGEKYLDEICKEENVGAFCHNAQSVRWLLELDNHSDGLNLCLQTLDGVLCHNGEMWEQSLEPDRGKTWDDFSREYVACLKDAETSKRIRPTTLEGCAMRVADVIGYVGRDIEDAIKLELIERSDLPKEAVDVLGDRNATIINELVMDLIENSAGRDAIVFSERVYSALRTLIDFNYNSIYKDPRCHEDESRMRRLFRSVYDDVLAAFRDPEEPSDVGGFRDYCLRNERLRDTPSERLAIDTIAGMTDGFFLQQARRDYLLPRRLGRTARD